MSREAARRAFLAGTDWADATLTPLAGDASLRRYDRLRRASGGSAVLMDWPRGTGGDIGPFCRIAQHLLSLGLSAPRLLNQDADAGFLLLEDLGDALFARVTEADPAATAPLYARAAEALAVLQAAPPPAGLAPWDSAAFAAMTDLAYDWYQAGSAGTPPEGFAAFTALFRPMLDRLGPGRVMLMRDFHAENLVWLPDRTGAAQAGLLDFQDAMMGHSAYDLVSLLQDARRDVDPALEEEMVPRFAALTGQDAGAFRFEYDLLGIQRNLRILGVFARLSMHFGRPQYIDLLPRVWGLLLRGLARPGMGALQDRLLRDLPEPSPQTLQILKDKCATVPLP